jgi:regulator of protease activity HflC (stomatin/prohibitin superfamily)
MPTELLFVFAVLVLFVIILLMKGIVIVRQAEVMIIERLGRYQYHRAHGRSR